MIRDSNMSGWMKGGKSRGSAPSSPTLARLGQRERASQIGNRQIRQLELSHRQPAQADTEETTYLTFSPSGGGQLLLCQSEPTGTKYDHRPTFSHVLPMQPRGPTSHQQPQSSLTSPLSMSAMSPSALGQRCERSPTGSLIVIRISAAIMTTVM